MGSLNCCSTSELRGKFCRVDRPSHHSYPSVEGFLFYKFQDSWYVAEHTELEEKKKQANQSPWQRSGLLRSVVRAAQNRQARFSLLYH